MDSSTITQPPSIPSQFSSEITPNKLEIGILEIAAPFPFPFPPSPPPRRNHRHGLPPSEQQNLGLPLVYTDDYIVLWPGERFYFPPGVDKQEMIDFFEQAIRNGAKNIALYGDGSPADGVLHPMILDYSSHHDGSIYRVNHGWHLNYSVSDRSETRLEPMCLSEPTNCYPSREGCMTHHGRSMMQIFSLKLAKLSVDDSPVQLYGYFAVRDRIDSSLNYIFNRSRDDPITVKQGSLIEITGPKRGIRMRFDVIVEFDMRIKKGGEEDDLQLIDGAVAYSAVTISSCNTFLNHIDSDCGAVDVTLAMLLKAVEATIQVVISEVHESGGFDLFLSSSINQTDEDYQLLHDVVNEPCGLRRCVVAVLLDTWIRLKLKLVDHRGGVVREIERCAYFKSKIHGSISQEIKFEQASIMVKIAWSA